MVFFDFLTREQQNCLQKGWFKVPSSKIGCQDSIIHIVLQNPPQ